MTEQLESFATSPHVLDRSTLERYATCPRQAVAVDSGEATIGNRDTDAGNIVHGIIAEAVRMRHMEQTPAHELRDFITEKANTSRPDLQPMVISSLRPSIYRIVEFLTRRDNGDERAGEDILRYDGGTGEYSGQLGYDVSTLTIAAGVRVTAELDLLIARSATEVDVCDWKSGWRHWTSADVGDSFQMQLQAMLVFTNYPRVETVRAQVWMTREGAATAPYEFTKLAFWRIHSRVIAAARLWEEYHGKPMSDVPYWPEPEKCSWCPALLKCKANAADAMQAPEAALETLAVLQAQVDKLHAGLTVVCRKRGQPIVSGNLSFEEQRPSGRARQCCLYEKKNG